MHLKDQTASSAESDFGSTMDAMAFNSLSNDKILDWYKFKALDEDNLNAAKVIEFVFDPVENTVGKGENAVYQHFLLFP